MTVDFPLPIRRSWVPTELASEKEDFDKPHSQLSQKRKIVDEKLEPSNAYLFVLFIKLPAWNSNDSRESTPEIKTLRNLKNGIEVYRIKASLELTAGLPAHVTTLSDINDENLTNNTRLVIGENVRSGSSLRLQVLNAWENIIKAVWTNNLPDLLANLPPKKDQKNLNCSSDYKEFASTVGQSLNEHAFCALFAASAKGNLKICKSILEAGYDPNQATFFGNSSLHSAAHNGQFEVIQLLITHGANVRCINSQKQTPLDIAASCGHIDCARWLWLNQWSVNLPKHDEEFAELPSRPSTTYISPSKPLQECSTLFSKSDAPTFPAMSVENSKTPKKSSSFRENLNALSTENRPISSPFSWRLNNRVSFATDNRFQTYAETKRPFTAAARKGDGGLSPKSPRLLPQISSALTRGRSIPSVQETRYESPSAARLKVDVRTSSFVKPISIHMPLTGQWINPKQNSVNFASSRNQPQSLEQKNYVPKDDISKKQALACASASSSSLHSSKSETFLKTQEDEKNNKAKSFLNDATEFSSKYQDFDKTKPVETNINVNFLTSLSTPNTKKITVVDSQPLNETDNILTNNLVAPHKNHSTVSAKSKSNQAFLTFDKPDLTQKNKSAPEKFSGSNFDPYVSLHGRGDVSLQHTSSDEKKVLSNLISQAKSINAEKKKKKDLSSNTPSQVPNILQSKHPVVKEKVYDRYKRKDSKTESKQDQSLSRDQQIRNERNKTAWMEWKAAKHKKAAANKKKQDEMTKQHDHAVRKWGMTFEEWLDEKKKEAEKKPAEEPVSIRTSQKTQRVVTGGKTFDEWLKEKKEEKSKESKGTEKKLSEADMKKAEEARQRSFAVWSAKKLEEAKREKEKQEKVEEKQKNSLSTMHEQWLNKDRVMSFDAWKKKKEKARKLEMFTQAQEDEKEYLATWASEQRREQAEKAFQQWLNRKHSVLLQEATSELEESKHKREETEKNLKIRRALLRAKILLRWERMTKRDGKLNKRRSQRMISASLSTGDLTDDASHVDNGKEIQTKRHSEDEEKVSFHPSKNLGDPLDVKSKFKVSDSNKTALHNEKTTTTKPQEKKEKSFKTSPSKSDSSSGSSDNLTSESETEAALEKEHKKRIKKVKKKRKKKTSEKPSKTLLPSSKRVSSSKTVDNPEENSLGDKTKKSSAQSQKGAQTSNLQKSFLQPITKKSNSESKKNKSSASSPYNISNDYKKSEQKNKSGSKPAFPKTAKPQPTSKSSPFSTLHDDSKIIKPQVVSSSTTSNDNKSSPTVDKIPVSKPIEIFSTEACHNEQKNLQVDKNYASTPSELHKSGNDEQSKLDEVKSLPLSDSTNSSTASKPVETKTNFKTGKNKVSLDYGSYKVDIGVKDKKEPRESRDQSSEQLVARDQNESTSVLPSKKSKERKMSESMPKFDPGNTRQEEDTSLFNADSAETSNENQKLNPKRSQEKIEQSQVLSEDTNPPTSQDNALLLRGEPLKQKKITSGKQMPEKRKKEAKKLQNVQDKPQQTALKNSKPPTPTKTTSSDLKSESDDDKNIFPTPAFSLVQAALNFIAKEEEAEKAVSPENSGPTIRKRITIEMPITHIDATEGNGDSASDNNSL